MHSRLRPPWTRIRTCWRPFARALLQQCHPPWLWARSMMQCLQYDLCSGSEHIIPASPELGLGEERHLALGGREGPRSHATLARTRTSWRGTRSHAAGNMTASTTANEVAWRTMGVAAAACSGVDLQSVLTRHGQAAYLAGRSDRARRKRFGTAGCIISRELSTKPLHSQTERKPELPGSNSRRQAARPGCPLSRPLSRPATP